MPTTLPVWLVGGCRYLSLEDLPFRKHHWYLSIILAILVRTHPRQARCPTSPPSYHPLPLPDPTTTAQDDSISTSRPLNNQPSTDSIAAYLKDRLVYSLLFGIKNLSSNSVDVDAPTAPSPHSGTIDRVDTEISDVHRSTKFLSKSGV